MRTGTELVLSSAIDVTIALASPEDFEQLIEGLQVACPRKPVHVCAIPRRLFEAQVL